MGLYSLFEMKHLTPYRLNETSLSPVRERGMGYGEVFTLSVDKRDEPFDTIPETFDFKEGDGQGAFVIRNISLK